MRIQEILLELDIPKNSWELIISNDDKQELGDDLVDLVQRAYSNTPQGSFVNSIKDVIPSDWNVYDWDSEPGLDATVFYRHERPNETWVGNKIQGLGHDGKRVSKDAAIIEINALLRQDGWWIESSDAMRHILKKLNAPAVTDEELLKRLFPHSDLQLISTDTYTRVLGDGTTVTETVFGNPVLKDTNEYQSSNDR